MKKKDFWKGFAAAIAMVLVCTLVIQTPLIQQWIPWNKLPFDLQMTRGAKLNLIENYLEKYYVEDLDEEMMKEGTFAGMMAGAGDRYTYYLTADNLRQYLQNSTGSFDGIGVNVYVNENGEIVIFSTMEGMGAEKAGLQAGDIIRSVDGESMAGYSLVDAAKKIQGESGTAAEITVYREAEKKEIPFHVERDKVVVKSVESEMLDHEKGYIAISGFKENTYEQFMEEMEKLRQQGMKGLILDLRNNPGGLVNSVWKIGEELLPKGLMVYTEDKNGKREEILCDEKYLEIPLVVLVNSGSASASEIFAGAAKDTQAGTLVGTQTFGKGLVQRLFLLPDGSGVNITIQKYYTPNGTSIHGTGITPDYIVELPEGYEDGNEIPREKDTQMEEGLGILDEKMKSESLK